MLVNSGTAYQQVLSSHYRGRLSIISYAIIATLDINGSNNEISTYYGTRA